MVRPEVIRRRLERLSEYIAILERLAAYSEDAFLADPERYGSAERFLQLALESVLDMGNHVIADEQLGTVNQSRDIPRVFREQGYIDPDMESRWLRMIGFRNILVHAYLDIDRQQVHRFLTHDLDDFRQLQRLFAAFL